MAHASTTAQYTNTAAASCTKTGSINGQKIVIQVVTDPSAPFCDDYPSLGNLMSIVNGQSTNGYAGTAATNATTTAGTGAGSGAGATAGTSGTTAAKADDSSAKKPVVQTSANGAGSLVASTIIGGLISAALALLA
jgi:hypothetical protein